MNMAPTTHPELQIDATPRFHLKEPGLPRFEADGATALPTNPQSPSPSRRRRIKGALMIAVLAAAVWGGSVAASHWLKVSRYIESTDDAYVGGDITILAPKVSGIISAIAVADNQAVKAGDLLLKLDDRDYRAALARTEAAVSFQEAALRNLGATRSLQQALIAQAHASLEAANAEISRTYEEHARFTELLKQNAVSVQDAQKADAADKEALAGGEKARAGLTAAERQLSVIDAQKEQIEAALAQAHADRDLARLNLSYTELRAPLDGIAGNRSAQVGAFASAGSQLIAVVPAHGLWVDANLKESQLARLRPGMPATVKIDSIPNKLFRGHVASVAPATGARFSILPPENATGNFTKIVQRVPVRIVLDHEEEAAGQLRPGLSVTARVNTAPARPTEERSAL